ncbi:MAG: hypothetical protein AB7R67_18970 [Vicinamibacterales bacterium]
MTTHATATPWGPNLQHARYATDETYALAAEWLHPCRSVDDWGGSGGYLRRFLGADVAYRVIDGTPQRHSQVVADLRTFAEPAEGICLRHVLDINADWRAILQNAVRAFRRRLVVVTFTPPAVVTTVVKLKSGWPVLHFHPQDLRDVMGAHLVAELEVETTHPEHLYLLERAS